MKASPRDLLDDAMSLMQSEINRMRSDVPLDRTDSRALAAYASVAATVVRDQHRFDAESLKDLPLQALEDLASQAIAVLQERGIAVGDEPAA